MSNINESPFVSKWRPALAWTYMIINIFDFIIAPLVVTWYSVYTGNDLVQWTSLTTADAGIFHMSMLGILSASAWTRGQEKIERIRSSFNNNDEKQNENEVQNEDQIET